MSLSRVRHGLPLLLLLAVSPALAQQSLDVPLVADTYLKQGTPNQNQDAETILRVRQSGKNRALVRVDEVALQQALQGGSVVSATLELTITDNGDNWGSSGRSIDAHRLRQAWVEAEATWNAPDVFSSWTMVGSDPATLAYDSAVSSSATITNGRSGVVSLDVTADVVAFLAGSKTNHGWLLKKTAEGQSGRIEFGTREGASPPRLVVSFVTGTGSELVVVSGDGQTGRGGSALAQPFVVEVRDANGAPVQGVAVVFSVSSGGGTLSGSQPQGTDAQGRAQATLTLGPLTGAQTVTATSSGLTGSPLTFTAQALPAPVALSVVADTYLKKGTPNQNQGTETILRLRQAGKNRALVQFDQAAIATVLQGKTLVSATLELEISDNGNNWGSSGRPIDAHRLTTAWNELEATWNEGRAGQAWDQDASDPALRPYVNTATASATVVNGQAGAVSMDVTADVAAFLAGTQNHGWLLKKTDESSAGRVDFTSRETALPPRLVLVFDSAGGPDTTPPTVTQPADLVAEQGGPAGTVVTYPLPTAVDNQDPNPAVTCTPASGSLFAPGVTVVTCTATDAAGNTSAPVTFTVTIQDTTAPALSQPADLVVEQGGATGSVVNYSQPTATDAVDPSPAVVCTPVSGSLFAPGVSTVTCTATDAAGNSASVTFSVTVQDTTAPTLSQPADLVVEQQNPAGAVVVYVAPTATDTVDPAPAVVCSPASGSTFAAGTTVVTCTATDAAGNTSAPVTFTVTVQDTTAPVVAQPADVVVEQAGPLGSVVTYAQPSATDAADVAPVTTCSPASGSLFPAGDTVVTCTATDASGNTSAPVTFTVTVQDTTAPVVDQPADVVVEQAGPLGTVVTYTVPTATDAADVAPVTTCSPAPGSLYPAGDTVVTCTSTDASGNAASVSFTVTVQDTTAPVLAQPTDVIVEQAGPLGSVVGYTVPTATDTADVAPVTTCSPASGSLFPAGDTLVTCTSTDASGNAASVSFTVTVRDTTAPVVAQPADVMVEQAGPLGSVVTYALPTATDTADVAPLTTCSPASGSLFPAGDTVVTCTATDASGNTSAPVTFTVTVQDTVSPSLSLAPASGAVLEQAQVALVASYTDAGSGPDTGSFQATLDGQDVTGLFQVDPQSAQATSPSLADGSHTFQVSLADGVGNVTTATTVFQVDNQVAVAFEVTVGAARARSGGEPDETPLLELAPEARSIDGSGNDAANPLEGSAGSLLQRLLSSDYGDGLAAPAGASRPSARAISNEVHAQAGSRPNAQGASDFLWLWGQFVGHDLSHTGAADPAEPFPIPVPLGDPDFDPQGTGTEVIPLSRSAHDPLAQPREQVNGISAWLDASMVYGSDPARAVALRTNDGTGRLLTSAGNLLPFNTSGLPNAPSSAPTFFLAGDERANEHTGVLALHTLFVREHNRLASFIQLQHPTATGEQIYQAARRLVGAEIQAITYQEFLPVLLGPSALAPYAGYDAAVDAGILNGFSTAAFRMGHSLISPRLLRLNATGQSISEGSLDLEEGFFAPDRLTDGGGIEPLLRGAAEQVCQELDPLLVDGVRNFLFGAPGAGGLDLASLNIQRGRDHGLPSYNEARRQLGLPARTSLAEISSDPEVQARLASAYADVEDVDVWTGGLAEDHLPGAMVGEVFHALIKRQFELLRDGDRFFFQAEFAGPALEALQQTRLADLIRRNTQIDAEIQDDVFTGAVLVLAAHDLTVRAVTSSGETATSFEGFTLVTTSEGLAPLDGLVFDFTAADQGRVVLPGLAFFRTPGPLVVTAQSLEPAPLDISGSVAVQVEVQTPLIYPEPPTQLAADGVLTLEGLSFPGGQVELVVDGQVVAVGSAGPTGQYGFSWVLAGGSHEVFVRGVDPQTGDLLASQSVTIGVPLPTPTGVTVTPSEASLAAGEGLSLVVRQRFSNGSSEDATDRAGYLSSDLAVATVDAQGVLVAVAPGLTTVTVSLDGFLALAQITVTAPGLTQTSPTQGEGDVATTRETVLRFSAPLDVASVTSDAVFAEFGGQRITTRLHVSPDQSVVTVFYPDGLPASARVRVTVDGEQLLAAGGSGIDGDGDGSPGGAYLLDFDTLSITTIPGTAVCGRVFASELAPSGMGSVNVALEGVRITVDGAESTLFAVTDALGDFRLEPAPAGRFFVHIDGRTATASIPAGAYYPFVGEPFESIPGTEINVGDFYLPLVQDGTLQAVSETVDTAITFANDVIFQWPHLQGVEITVPADSLYADDGTRGGMVGIAPVPPDRIPGVLPPGLDFSVVITVQTDGATNFDVPLSIRFPNVEGLAPGEKTALWSFNHDTGRFEIVGSMTVSDDGLWVVTDPGVGILAPGWHGVQSGAQGGGGEVLEGPAPNIEEPVATGNQPDLTSDGRDPPSLCKAPNAVILSSGEERFDRVDLSIPGRGGAHFSFRRRYRSQLTYDGPLGHGWDFDYNEHLFVRANGDVVRVNGRSHIVEWTRLADGSYQAPTGYFSALVRELDGSFVLREPNGFKRFYRADGALYCHQDRNGNLLLFEYDSFGDLDAVIDPYGREIDFQFEVTGQGVNEKRRLRRIVDFMGREILYSYDAEGNLAEVRTPVVVGTSTGNDFPSGRSERYTYSTGFSDDRLNHNILTVTYPEEAATGGPPALTWTYGTDSLDSLTFDKVLTLTEGGVNASGVSAGGTMTLVYETLNEGVPLGDLSVLRGKVTVTERNGNSYAAYVNELKHHILTQRSTRGFRPGEPAFYETRSFFDADGQLLRRVLPEGNETRYVYGSGNRASERNLIEVRRVAGPRGGGEDLVTTFGFEPLFNRLAKRTDPRGNATGFSAPLGTASAERYTKRYLFDYQEGNDPIPDVLKFGLDISGIARDLGDLNGDGRVDQVAGNVVRVQAPSVELLPGSNEAARLGSTTQEIFSESQWNDQGQVLATIDAEGNVVTFGYYAEDDPDGDGQRVPRTWLPVTGAPTGYMSSMTIDAGLSPRRTAIAPPAALETKFRYDPVGNVVALVNPRGIETQFEVTALNEVVVARRGAAVGEALANGQLLTETLPFGYQARAFYDHNGRITKTEIENRDGNTQGVGPYVERRTTFDMLHNVLEQTAEVDATTVLTWQFGYDEEELLTLATQPEGNQVKTSYDERNLPLRVTRGFGTTEASTTQVDYDLNANRESFEDAEDNDGDGLPERSTLAYDGFDRVSVVADRLGNEAHMAYDVASNVVQRMTFGHPANSAGAANVLLQDTRFSHDELNRVFQADASLFLADGFSTLRPVDLRDQNSDGFVTSRVEYDALSRVTFTIQDDLQVTRVVYDGVSRPVETIDAVGNRLFTSYDRNSNPVRVQSVEISVEGRVVPETFTSHNVFDQLDRLVRVTDNAGQTVRFRYDSRDNLVFRSDAVGALVADPLGIFPDAGAGQSGLVNGPGNTCSYVYDGIDRQLRQVCDLRVGGAGSGGLDLSNPNNPDGQISLGYGFDDNSRLTSITDDNGNVTQFGYDALNRNVLRVNADGESFVTTYDRDSNVRTVTDPNGTVVTKSYDVLNRLVSTQIARGLGVVGTTAETFGYDGLSRLTASSDDNGSLAATQVCERVYDSLSRTLEERLNGQAVSTVWSGDSKRLRCVYPGGRQIDSTFDLIDRLKSCSDQVGLLAESDWIGPGYRELERRLGNGTRQTHLDVTGTVDVGYDAVKRVVREQVLFPNGTPVVDRQYTYNRANVRTSELRHDWGGQIDVYTYDSAYRIVQTDLDQAGVGADPRRDTDSIGYVLDGVGNRRAVTTTDTIGTESTEAFQVNVMNEYESAGSTSFNHDDNGNRTSDGTRAFVYDYRNRLVGVLQQGSGIPIAGYRYYADNRRAEKRVYDGGGTLTRTTAFFYDGWKVCEEQDGAGATETTYVWHPVYIDELVSVERTPAAPEGAGRFWAHQNVRADVVAVTDAAGALVERVRYDDFGNPEYRDAAGAASATSPSGLAYAFQGRRLDPETGLYYFRNRYYDAALGRFLQRDPVWDAGNVGGWYSFVGSGPASGLDPSGLTDWALETVRAIRELVERSAASGEDYTLADIDDLVAQHLEGPLTKKRGGILAEGPSADGASGMAAAGASAAAVALAAWWAADAVLKNQSATDQLANAERDNANWSELTGGGAGAAAGTWLDRFIALRGRPPNAKELEAIAVYMSEEETAALAALLNAPVRDCPEQGRNPLGRFMFKNAGEASPGSTFSAAQVELMKSQYPVTQSEVWFRPYNEKGELSWPEARLDQAVGQIPGEIDRVFEYKNSATAPRTGRQSLAYPPLGRYGGEVSRGGAGNAFPKGTQIPPGSFEERRP